jgi:aldose 1-epimerase
MIKKELFDNYNGRQVNIYELSNDKIKVGIIDFGAAIQYIKLNLPTGERDVCLGFDNVAEYIKSGMYCGATIGRVANRIEGATFKLNGKTYNIPKNDGNNCNHGGTVGFDKKFYDVKEDVNEEGDKLIFSLLSPDGDMGFAGNLNLDVQFSLTDTSLQILYAAKSDKETLFAPTCHIYFNLSGSGMIYDDLLKINADSFTPITPSLIPTGKIKSVKGTPFDFTKMKAIGCDINKQDEQLKYGNGYDHNFVLSGEDAATAKSADGLVELDLKTDLLGLQLYSGNFINGVGKNGVLVARQGFCLEPQFFPNAVNTPSFAKPILPANKVQKHYITYKFKF